VRGAVVDSCSNGGYFQNEPQQTWRACSFEDSRQLSGAQTPHHSFTLVEAFSQTHCDT